MPLVRIDLKRGRTPAYGAAVGDQVHRALIEVAKVPELDRFQVITEHCEGLVYPIQITLNAGRTLEVKRALYRRIAELLAADPGIDPSDVIINLVEVPKENWSFGRGEAPYA